MTKTLHAFYDMAVSPCSFDFFSFLISAELCRCRRNLSSMHLHIIRGPNKNFRDDNLRTDEQNLNQFHNVIIPGISILPSIEKFDWIDRNETSTDNLNPYFVFPRGYSLSKPVADYSCQELVSSKVRREKPVCFKPPAYAEDLAQKWISELKNKKIVTITARELQREDPNNSRKLKIKSWEEAVEKMKSLGYTPILIRDTEKVFSSEQPLQNVLDCAPASIHLPFRLAVYEAAFKNFSKANGPAFLQYFSQGSSSVFLSLDESVASYTSAFYRSNFGMEAGSAFPMSRTNMTYIWDNETSEKILSEISEKKEKVTQNHGFNSENNILFSLEVTIGKLIRELRFGQIFPEDIVTINAIEKTQDDCNLPRKYDVLQIIRNEEGNFLPKGTINAIQEMSKRVEPSFYNLSSSNDGINIVQ